MPAVKLYYPYNGNKPYHNGEYITFASIVYLCVEDALPTESPSTKPLKWVVPFGSGSGSVTSVTAGDLSPVFTTSVANPATAPVISFAQISQLQNLFFGSPDGAPGNPTFRAIVAADLPALDTTYWALAGNNTSTTTKKIGTTSNADIAITANNVQTGTWFKTGEWGVGITASPLAKFHVKGAGNTASVTIGLYVENSDSTQSFGIFNNGVIGRNGAVHSIRAGTTTTSWGQSAGLASNGLNKESVYVGYFAGANCTSVGVVSISGDTNNNASANFGAKTIAIGNGAVIGTTGLNNVALGVSAGSRTTTGSSNTYLGSYADRDDSDSTISNITGNYNIVIGSLNLGASEGTSYAGGNAFSSVFAVHGLGSRSNQIVFGGGMADTWFDRMRIGYDTTASVHTTFYRTSTPEGSQAGEPGDDCHVNDSGTGEYWIKTTGSGNTGWSQLI